MRARNLADSALQTLRQPRYAALFAAMAVVALACIAAGTWQILRFESKVHANDALTHNAEAIAAPVGQVLPLVGSAPPSRDAVRYRTVTAVGTYLPQQQTLVRLRSIDDSGDQGFYVLTPLRTADATLLVVRGFVAALPNGDPPAAIEAAPKGTVVVQARVQTAETGTVRPSGIPAGQVSRIIPSAEASRLDGAVYNGWAELLGRQPGTAGLTAIPAPDLSNPAGGAVEPQHFAYIIQWYLFAALALAAPFAMARAERREHRDEDEPDSLDGDDVDRRPVQPASADERRAAKLADRYGRPVH